MMKQKNGGLPDPTWPEPKSIAAVSTNAQRELINWIINLSPTVVAVKDNEFDCGGDINWIIRKLDFNSNCGQEQ